MLHSSCTLLNSRKVRGALDDFVPEEPVHSPGVAQSSCYMRHILDYI